jgi:hypothetical protein
MGAKLKNSFPNIDIFVRCQFFKAEYGGEHTEEVLQRGGALKVLPRLIFTLNLLIQVFKKKP